MRLHESRLDPAATTDRALATVHRLWREKRGARAVPLRSDIDPSDLKPVLGMLSLVDVRRRPLRFTFRLNGSQHNASFNFRDATGRSLDEVEPPAYRRMVERHWREALELGEPTLYAIELEHEGLRVAYTRLVAPLSVGGDEIDILLICAAEASSQV